MAVVQALIEDTGEIAEAVVVARKDRDSFRTACPVGELSIGPAAEGEDGGAGDVDLSAGGGFPAVLERFLRMIRVSVYACV